MPSGVVELWNAWTSFTQPQSNSTVPPRFGSETFSTPCSPSQLARLDQRDAVRAGALGDRDGVGDVVDVRRA